MFLAVGRQLWRTSSGPLKLVGNRILHKLPWHPRAQSVGDGEPQPVLDGVKRRFLGGNLQFSLFTEALVV